MRSVRRSEYYQRPDTLHVSLDPSRTSLAGWAGRINLNRNSGLWQVNAALWVSVPGLNQMTLDFTARATAPEPTLSPSGAARRRTD